MRTVREGAVTTWAVALVVVVYVALTWSGPNRTLLLAIVAAACLEAGLIVRFGGPLVRSDAACERFVFGWGVLHVAVIAWLCVLDGGVGSPFVAFFLVSVAYAGEVLPHRRVMIIGGLNAAAVVAIAELDPSYGAPHAAVVVWIGSLLIIAARCAAIAAYRDVRGAELVAAREELLRRLARVVEYRDDDTGAHVERMAGYTALIAEALGVPEDEVGRIRLASTMHDIGKVAVPDAILHKPGPLTQEERAVMQRHAQVGHEMLSGSGTDLLDLAATIALTHHERHDGGGYPHGLRGEDIPLVGRIVAVADAFDAITSKRVYKDAVAVPEAIAIIGQGRGTQFDPRVVDAFDRAIAALVPTAAARPVASHGAGAATGTAVAAGNRVMSDPADSQPSALTLHDPRRLSALRELAILDTPPESDFDDLAALAAAVCRSPVGAVNFVDDQRHFTKAIVGMPDALGSSVSNDLSFCATTVQTSDGVLVIPDTHADDQWHDHPLVRDGPELGFYIGASIHSAGKAVGVVCAFGPEPREITAQDRAALVMLAQQAEARLEERRRHSELRDLALNDALTGLPNRSLMYDRLQQALTDRSGVGHQVGVLFCDVDNFKSINDHLGHATGDAVLCDVAATLRSVARETDTPARLAGDEFVLVCPHLHGTSDLDAVLDRLTQAMAGRRPLTDGFLPPRVSVGAVLARPGESVAEVLRRADHEMYSAKAHARLTLAPGAPARKAEAVG